MIFLSSLSHHAAVAVAWKRYLLVSRKEVASHDLSCSPYKRIAPEPAPRAHRLGDHRLYPFDGPARMVLAQRFQLQQHGERPWIEQRRHQPVLYSFDCTALLAHFYYARLHFHHGQWGEGAPDVRYAALFTALVALPGLGQVARRSDECSAADRCFRAAL